MRPWTPGTLDYNATAQIIIALTTLGINPRTNGDSISVLVNTFNSASGAVIPNWSVTLDEWSTRDAVQALIAYDRFISGRATFFNMAASEARNVILSPPPVIVPPPGGGVVVPSPRFCSRPCVHQRNRIPPGRRRQYKGNARRLLHRQGNDLHYRPFFAILHKRMD